MSQGLQVRIRLGLRGPRPTATGPRLGGHPLLLSHQAAAATKVQLEPAPGCALPAPPSGTYHWCTETRRPRRPRSGPGGRLRRRQGPVSLAGT